MKPFDLRPRRTEGRRTTPWALLSAWLILGGVALIPGFVVAHERAALQARQSELRAATAELTEARQRVLALQPHADRHDRRLAMTQAAQSLLAARIPWAGFLERLSLVVPDAVQLTSLTGAVPASRLPGTSQTAAAGTPDLTFTGTAWSHGDVAKLMRRLALLPDITDIRLAATAEASAETTTGPAVIAFTLTASLSAATQAPSSPQESDQ